MKQPSTTNFATGSSVVSATGENPSPSSTTNTATHTPFLTTCSPSCCRRPTRSVLERSTLMMNTATLKARSIVSVTGLNCNSTSAMDSRHTVEIPTSCHSGQARVGTNFVTSTQRTMTALSTLRLRATGWGHEPTSVLTTREVLIYTLAEWSTQFCTCCTHASGTRCSTTSAT